MRFDTYHAQYKTVRDIVKLLLKNGASDNPELREHANGLWDRRTRGSITEIGLNDLDQDLLDRPLHHIYHDAVAKGCTCFRADLPEMRGKVLAIPFDEAFGAYEGSIKVRKGTHGLELYIDLSIEELPEDAGLESWIYFIIGDEKGEEALFTWHPGSPLFRLEDGICSGTGVKLHNG